MLDWRRSHKDSFEGEWEQIFSWLVANPEQSSAAPRDAINYYKSAPSSAACGTYELTFWKRTRSTGKWK